MHDAGQVLDDVSHRLRGLKRTHVRGITYVSAQDMVKAETQQKKAKAAYSSARVDFERCDNMMREFESRGFAEVALRKCVRGRACVWVAVCLCLCPMCHVPRLVLCCVAYMASWGKCAVGRCKLSSPCPSSLCLGWFGVRWVGLVCVSDVDRPLGKPQGAGGSTAVLQLLHESGLLVRRDLNTDYEARGSPGTPHRPTAPTQQ